ncbi:caspase-8 isoform X2 [Monomorium pharaonis]|uniref:caspase-8 isoform X2 n=1 Tax=Monomorium pharaonis TaxID=307658 RepID=UPI001745F306|nr:caspase-8 isoform X2 [Monomorium pharaonis]
MSLSLDAIACSVAETVINTNILKKIEDDLEIDEKISILFLIIDNYANGFNDIFKLLQTKTENAYIITDYVRHHPENWKEKILEAICILNNREVIRKLKLSFSDLNLKYVPNVRSYSRNLNIVAKCLYRLCESLNNVEQKLLLNCVKSENCNYEQKLDNKDYLELHMLYWIQINYITISKDETCNMKNLLKHLQTLKNGYLRIICMDLEKFENSLHVVDNRRTCGTNNENYLQSTLPEELSHIERHYYGKKIINSGLCIIINQMNFRKEYETRHGTKADSNHLSETFKTFGFKTEIHQDLKKSKMLEKIRNISKDYGNKYDCLFLCILSHGYKGSIGNNFLTTDDLSDSFAPVEDIRQFANFFMFMSTIQGFLSIRHKEEGSWFIQEVCKIFKTCGNELTFHDCVRKIMKSVRERKGTIDGNQIAQLSEIRQDRLESDFQLKLAI